MKPEHYKSREVHDMDVIDLVKHWGLNFNEGNILKYLLRDKNQDIEDLKKIIDYAQRELKHLENTEYNNEEYKPIKDGEFNIHPSKLNIIKHEGYIITNIKDLSKG